MSSLGGSDGGRTMHMNESSYLPTGHGGQYNEFSGQRQNFGNHPHGVGVGGHGFEHRTGGSGGMSGLSSHTGSYGGFESKGAMAQGQYGRGYDGGDGRGSGRGRSNTVKSFIFVGSNFH